MPMKVVVCFDSVRVTVPCGEGEILVQELINKAVHRYKRAVGKGADHRVEVTSLKAISGGGILDPDDQLCDVVDDREQLIAEYEEQNRPPHASLPLNHHQHNGGDGASASSTGTTSPEPFSLLPHQNLHLPLSLSHHAPGDSISSSSSSAATGPPLPSMPPPDASSFDVLPPTLPSSVAAVVGERSEVTSQHDSSSSNSNNAVTDVVITPRDLSLGSTLRVRRGSEPNLASLVDSVPTDKLQIASGNLRPFLPRRESVRDSDEPRSESSDDEKLMRLPMTNSLDRKKIGMARFTRDSLRSSLSSRPEMYKWLEAQQRAEEHSKALRVEERLGPVEGHDGEDVNNVAQRNECLVYLQNDGGPLGIHAVPALDANGTEKGLLIQSIEPNRPVHRDGRIQPKDIIVEINGTSLQHVPFIKAQEVFRAAMDTHEICLKVLKDEHKDSVPEVPVKRKPAPQPPPVMPKPRNHAPLKPSPLAASPPQKPSPAPRDLSKNTPPSSLHHDDTVEKPANAIPSHIKVNDSNTLNTAIDTGNSNSNTAINGQNPDHLFTSMQKKAPPIPSVIRPGPPIKAPKKAAPALPARTPSTSVPAASAVAQIPTQSTSDLPINAIFNTRRIGKKIVIKLTKGPLGLGFSVTSRDNQTGGDCPIYIRNILPKGAAVQDGQLRSGDRLLEVNGVEMTGKTQAEAVAFLRTLAEGSVVELVVSRQEEVDEKFKVPRKMSENPALNSQQPVSDTCELSESPDINNDDDDDDDDDEYTNTVLSQHPSQSLDSIDGVSGKEKITLRIPLNETNSAGLGVSVKGKTQSSQTGLQDLGIFVKTVLQGGAAYKDGRLKVNDQLLEVNNVKLQGQPNTAAMEALRTAMLEEGSGSGFITLTVLRRSSNSPFSPVHLDDQTEGNSQSDGGSVMGSQSFPNHHGYKLHKQPSPRSGANTFPIIHQRSSSASDTVNTGYSRFGTDNDEMPSPIPPARSKRVAALRERFSTDQGNGLRNESYTRATNESISMSPSGGNNGIRNDSYARATHDSLNDSGAFSHVLPSQLKWNQPSGDTQEVKENIPFVEQDPFAMHKQQRPHSSIGFLHGSKASHNSISDDEAFMRDSVASSKEENDMSPSFDLIAPFAREGFGRQSMSEKRKGHLDPRSTETYKMVKANKENKGTIPAAKEGTGAAVPQQPPAQSQTAPLQPVSTSTEKTPETLQPNTKVHDSMQNTYQPSRSFADQQAAIKKSSSVEDLSNPAQNIVSSSSSGNNQNRDASPMWRHNRFGRARACNDSFRAAVDRSYDALDPALMDTLEEESAESGAFTLDPSNSGRSSISSDNPEDTNSLKRRKAKEKEKKVGLLKGFLRFGKGRKSNEEAMRRSRSEERPTDRMLVEKRQDQPSDELSNDDAWIAQPFGDAKTMGFVPVPDFEQQPQQRGRRLSKPDQERIDEEYARLRDQHVSQQRLRSQSVDPSSHRHTSTTFTPSSWERSSPFQPYGSPHIHRQPGLLEDYNRRQQENYDHEEQNRQLESHADLRRFHPAGLNYRQENSGHDHRENKQYFSQSDQDEGRPPLAKAVLSRAEYIQQLRSLYQQRHKQRQGVYPLDDAEEKYERQIQEMEKRGIPTNSEGMNDSPRDPHLLRFTDRPPSRQLEQRRSERATSSSSMGNTNFNSMYSGNAKVGGTGGGGYSHYFNEYNTSSAFINNRPHSRGATTAYESSNFQHQNIQTQSNYQYHPHQHYQHQKPFQQLQGYDYPYRPNYRDYSYSDDNNSASYSRPTYDSYAQDQFYRGPPQAYRSASNQYHQHRSTTPYSDPTSAKV